MFLPTPSNDLGVLPDEHLVVVWQTNWHDVLLEDDVGGQPNEGQVVPEVRRVVLGVNVFALL